MPGISWARPIAPFGERASTRYRLSCQIVCDHDMAIAEVAMTKANQDWTDTGPAPEPGVTPEATFFPKDELTQS